MTDLEKAREKIEAIDSKLAVLFEERMKTAEEIADAKLQGHVPLEDSEREKYLLDKSADFIQNPEYRGYFRVFLQNCISLSKGWQGARMAPKDVKIIPFASASGGYFVALGNGILDRAEEFFNLNRKVLVVTDKRVPEQYAFRIAKRCKKAQVLILDAGEAHKGFDSYRKIMTALSGFSFTRGDCLIAVGGGIVADTVGFVASTYMRGIDYYTVPTTLLAQVDASVGGKTAIDMDGYKNVVGSFYSPKAVLMDTDVLKTLPPRHIANGLAEAIKTAVVGDETLLQLLEEEDMMANPEKAILRCVLFKKSIVERDEHEGSLRRILNFGHTIGHAIESAADGSLLHGESIAIGMLPMCGEELRERVEKVLQKYQLPTSADVNESLVLNAIRHDKKAGQDVISVIRVEEIGKPIIETVDVDDLESKIHSVISQ